MKPSLRKIKNQIKLEPVILVKKPWFLFVMPIIIPIIIYNRFKRSETVVYLTETKLPEILADDRIIKIPHKSFITVTRFNEFSDYALKRINEDAESGNLSLNIIRKRFDRGDYAIVYLDPYLNPLSYVFICTKLAEFTPVGINLPLPELTFGMYDVYTFRDKRGQGYYAQLFWHSIKQLQKQGYDKMWLWLMTHNIVSLQVHKNLGLNRINKILKEELNFGIIRRTVMDVEMSLDDLKTNG